MLVFEVELLHGTYRADPDGSAPTGRQTSGEWPPAPSRLLAALIAADGTGSQTRRTTGAELEVLAAADPPVIHADSDPHHQPLEERFVAGQDRARSQQQEYLARTGVLVRPGVRVVSRNPSVRFVYDVEISDDDFAALGYRAARVGYLGCADSPVHITVARPADLAVEGSEDMVWVPDPDGLEVVNVHAAGDVARWTAAFEAWSNHGATRSQTRRYQPRAHYRHPLDPVPDTRIGRVPVWLRFQRPVSGRRAAVVAHGLKQATLARYQQGHGDPPSWLHGHVNDGESDYQIARFLALPNVGHRHSDGKIHGGAVWVPNEVDEIELRNLASTLSSLESLSMADSSMVNIDRSRGGWTTNPRRWQGPARRWVTALPAVSDRHQRIDSTAVTRWCEQAGLPRPIQVRISRKPLLPGSVDLHPTETRRPGHTQTRPYAHVELAFEVPVSGPVVIGSARSYGLGLCAPCDPRED